MESLRSSVWSSETLVQGMKEVTSQPTDFLVKDEDADPELAAEFAVSLS